MRSVRARADAGSGVSPGLLDLPLTTPGSAADWLSEVGPEVLVARIRSASDADLEAALAAPDVRRAAVVGILERLHEYAVPDRLHDLVGTLRIDLRAGRSLLERHGLVLDHGVLTVLPDVDVDVDVVLHTDPVGFLRLVSGQSNAGLMYLSGGLDIEGDAELALAIGGIFRVPGSRDVAVDPRALDPVEVATALTGVSTDHLRAVMASGFRPVVLDEIFRRLPDFVDRRKALRADLTVGFRLLGRADGGIDRYVVHVGGGEATVTPDDDRPDGRPDDRPRDATITCEAADFLRLATGHLSAVSGVMRGQLKVRGDKARALQLSGLLDIPRPR